MGKITREMVEDWEPFHPAKRLIDLFDRAYTPLEVLTRKYSPWANVPNDDRLWIVLHKNVLPNRVFRLFACDCANRALRREVNDGKMTDSRSWDAVKTARQYATKDASLKELEVANKEAWWAAMDCVVPSSAWASANSAHGATLQDAAEAAREASFWAARKTIDPAAEYESQISTLICLLDRGNEGGCKDV